MIVISTNYKIKNIVHVVNFKCNECCSLINMICLKRFHPETIIDCMFFVYLNSISTLHRHP